MKLSAILVSFVALLSLTSTLAFAQNESDASSLTVNREEANKLSAATSKTSTSVTAKIPAPISFLGVIDTLGTPGDLSAMAMTTTVGLMYNMKDQSTVGFGQDIESTIHYRTVDSKGHPTDNRYNDNQFGWTTLRYTIAPAHLLGSEKIFGLVRYYMPTAANDRWLANNGGQHLTSNQGMLRGDFEVPFMLSPHFVVSYYLNPRLNMVSNNDPNFDFGRGYARINQYGYAYYVPSDTLKFYTYFGYENRWGTNENMRMYLEKAIPGAGVSKDLAKGVNLTAEVTHAMLLVNDNLAGQSSGLNGYDLRPDNLNFEVTLFTLL